MSARPRILVIDDNLDLAQNIAEILEDDGAEVAVAESGSAGLDLLARDEFALVVTDMRMPGMNGLEVIRYIKRRWPALPVLVMTAYARDELLDEARNEGALRVMIKGIDVGELTGWIMRFAAARLPVLLVEDDDGMRTDLIEVLQDLEGVVPHPARDAGGARRLAASCRPRAAIIDLRLPDADGLELGRELRKIVGSPDLPVLYITGYVKDFADSLRSLLAHGDVTLLEKPFVTTNFLDTVRAMLHRPAP